jgi:hypothetical protein
LACCAHFQVSSYVALFDWHHLKRPCGIQGLAALPHGTRESSSAGASHFWNRGSSDTLSFQDLSRRIGMRFVCLRVTIVLIAITSGARKRSSNYPIEFHVPVLTVPQMVLDKLAGKSGISVKCSRTRDDRLITINAERSSDRFSVTHNMNSNKQLC